MCMIHTGIVGIVMVISMIHIGIGIVMDGMATVTGPIIHIHTIIAEGIITVRHVIQMQEALQAQEVVIR